jgi:POT family proton-dependent oligopeptide transporter
MTSDLRYASHSTAHKSTDFLGHPKGLSYLFATEMWERFSYFGNAALVAQPFASQLFGFYTGLAYSMPILGGLIADRALGQCRTVLIGGVFMACGHFMMAFESLFLFALLMVILGIGAFKPNVSTQVGDLYPPGDPRRDRVYSIFYVGINIGALLARCADRSPWRSAGTWVLRLPASPC